MRADSALSATIRDNEFPDSRLAQRRQPADHAERRCRQHRCNALRIAAGGGVTVGGILLGAALPVHIMTPSSTVRRIVDMTAFATADAGAQRGK